jgi:hypothetical protein
MVDELMTSPGLVDAATARVALALRRRANTLERITRLQRDEDSAAEIRRLAKREIARAFLHLADELEASGTEKIK